jgi:hypothetical protein
MTGKSMPQARIPLRASTSLGGIVILICAAAIVGARLNAESLWLDETYTWWFASLDWADLLQSVRIDGVNPPLYYMLVKTIAGANPAHEARLRLLSAVMHLVAVGLAWIMGRRLGGELGGWVTAAFWGFHPLSLWFALDARPYALAAALSWLTLFFYHRLERHASFRWGTVLPTALAIGAGLISHYFFLVICLGLTLVTLTRLRSNPVLFRAWTLALLLGFIPLGVWLAWYLSLPSPSLGIGWIAAPELHDIPLTFWNLLSGYGGVNSVPTITFGLANIVLMTRLQRRGLELIAFAVLPGILGVWLVSQWRPVYVDRYFILLLPLLAVSLGQPAAQLLQALRKVSGLSGGDYSDIAFAFVYAMIALGATLSLISLNHYRKEDFRGLAAELGQRPGAHERAWLSEAELTLPMRRYATEEWQAVMGYGEAVCGESCRWILRQPYTETHALTGAVSDPSRPWLPEVPGTCRLAETWQGDGGIHLWSLRCRGIP